MIDELLEEICGECHEPNFHKKEAFYAGFEYAKEVILKEVLCGELSTVRIRILNLKVVEKDSER